MRKAKKQEGDSLFYECIKVDMKAGYDQNVRTPRTVNVSTWYERVKYRNTIK